MRLDLETLEALKGWYSPETLARSLRFILRVPEAWFELSDPDFRGRIRRLVGEHALSPAKLGWASLDIPPDQAPDIDALPADLEHRVDRAWIELRSDRLRPRRLADLHLIALALARELSGTGDEAWFLTQVRADPRAWRSPLALAWPWLRNPEALVAELARWQDPAGVILVANSLLANYGDGEAVRRWPSLAPELEARAVQALHEHGERELAKSLSAREPDDPSDAAARSLFDDPELMLLISAKQIALGDLEAAQFSLERAVQRTGVLRHSIAELAAGLAHARRDTDLLHSVKGSLSEGPATAWMRARMALALIENGDLSSAESLLSKASRNPGEMLAVARLFVEQGNLNLALGRLSQVLSEHHALAMRGPIWIDALVDTLHCVGDTLGCLQVMGTKSAIFGHSDRVQLDLAERYLSWGDPISAERHAAMASALSPDSEQARRTLARVLAEKGDYARAAPLWRDLAEADSTALFQAAECALQAGDLKLARDVLARLSAQAPTDVREKILLGRISSAGQEEDAEEILRAATKSSPGEPETWLALASHLREREEFQGELEALAAGVQAAPADGAVKIAYARALKREHRLSEALSAVEQAYEIDPDRADWILERGKLLLALGHPHRAIDDLQRAIGRQPLNPDLRRISALAYEQVGDGLCAWEILTPILDRLRAEDYLLAGRLSTLAGKQGDENALEIARRYLQRAEAIEPHEQEIEYWLGEVFLAAGDHSRAKTRFESFLSAQTQREVPGIIDRRARIGLSEAVLQAGDSDAALEILEGAFDLYAHDGAYLTQLSRAQLAAGNLTNALASAELAVEIDPRHEGAFEALREAASSTGKWPRAISLLRTLTSQEPLETGHWFKLALLGLGSERRELTRQALAGALCVDRRDPALLARAGEILAVLGEKRSAFRLLGKAARLAPENPDYLVDFALKGEDLAEWDTSLGAWLDLQDRRPDDTRAILGIARCLTAQGRTDEAILKLQAGLEDDPGASDLFLALAKALLDDNRKLAAVDLLSRAHRRFQNDAEVTKSAGLLMLSNGPAESALEILKAAVRLQPYDKDVLIATADCCSRLGMFEESVRILRAVSSDQESSALASALFATAALQAGDDQAVNEALRCCLDAQPSTEREFELLTEALLRLGDWERAAAHAKSWHARHRSEASIRALIRLHLRLADAHWLFTQLSKATHHGPSVQWVGEGSRADLATLLAAAEEIGLSDNQMELFEAHRILSFEAPAEQQFAQCEELLLLQPAPEVIESLALAHLRSGDAMHCIRILSSELAAPLQLEWAPLLQGIAYRQQGDYELADLQLDESRGRSMLRPYASFQAAVSSYEQGEISIAISRLNEALSICPKEPAWHHLLGRLYRQGDELDAALPHFQRACELAPAESEYALSLARAYRALGQPVAAVEIYAGMLKASAGESDLWREAGQVCLEAEDYHRAGEYFQRAVDISPADPIALIGYAQAAGAVGQNRFARDLAQKALRASPRDPQVLVGLAGLLRSEGKLAAALDVYAKAIDLSGDPLAVRLDRADLLAEAGETDQAIADLQMAAGERPENDQIWGALARALEKAGRFEPAQEAISRAVSIAPRNVNHRLQLARLCRKSGQLDRALHELAELKASAGLDYRLPVEMGRVYEARRDHSSALRWYQQAISQNPHNAEAYYRAGYVLKALKAYPQAGKMLKRAVDLDPKNTEAHHQLAAVRALELVHYTINSPVGSI